MFRKDKRHRIEWPNIDLYNQSTRSDIKLATLSEVDRFVARAEQNGWSAVGRPEWLAMHRDRIINVIVMQFGKEASDVFRCLCTAMLDIGTGHSFTLDVSEEDFSRLDDVPIEMLVVFAHRYLIHFPPLPLDPSQEESWRRLGPE